MTGLARESGVNSSGAISNGETRIRCSKLVSEESQEELSKRRQLPVADCGVQPEGTYQCAAKDSNSDDTKTAEFGQNDDITDRKHATDIFIYPLSSIYVYMKSETGWAPYVCEYCDYKTTVDIMFVDHMNLHHIYSDSDDSE